MKRLIKELMIWVYSIVHRDTAAKVVFYHDIGTKYTPMGTELQVFKEHMKILEEVEKKGGEGKHVICFDDGFRGLWDHREEVKSISVKCKVKVFVAPRLVGEPGYLTWEEIRTLNREYGVDFQSHTWSHQTLVGPWNDDDVPREERTESWYERELIASRETINRELRSESVECKADEKCVVDELCFPVGYFSEELIERCKKAGYKKVYASFPGSLVDSGKCVVVPRCLVQDLSPMAFKAALNGGMNIFKARYLARHKVG